MLSDEPDLTAELDVAEDIVMGEAAPEWWVLLPGAPWGGQTAILGPYGEVDARAQFARTARFSGPKPKLLRTVEDEEP